MKKLHIIPGMFLALFLVSLIFGQDTTNQTTGSMNRRATLSASMSQEIMDRDTEIQDVVKNNDIVKFGSFLADEYVSVDAMGMRNKDEHIQLMKNVRINSVQKSDEKVIFPSDDVAILTYKAVYDRTVNGQDASGTFYASSTFVKRNGQWMVVQRTMSKVAR